MEIRAANESDAEATIEFLRRYRGEGLKTVLQYDELPGEESQRTFIRSLSGARGVMFIALSEGTVVGSITAEVRRHPQLRHSCEFGMGVLSVHRRRGIGTALISRVMDWALGVGITRVELCVAARNIEAVRLYERLGFRVEGVKIGALRIDKSFEDIIEMVKEPNKAPEPTPPAVTPRAIEVKSK